MALERVTNALFSIALLVLHEEFRPEIHRHFSDHPWLALPCFSRAGYVEVDGRHEQRPFPAVARWNSTHVSLSCSPRLSVADRPAPTQADDKLLASLQSDDRGIWHE